VECACAAIAAAHETEGEPNPMTDQSVRAVRRGLRRILGTAPRRQSRPLSTDEIRRMVAQIDRTTARGARDAAIILLGFASALRRSELAGLQLDDIEPKPEGLLVRVRKSKTDPEAHGQLVGVAHGSHAETDPVTALDAWLAIRGTDPGQLFTGFHLDRIGSRPFTGSGLARMLKERAAAAGIPSERVSGHSLRAGHATTAATNGVGLDRIAAQTGTPASPPSSSTTSAPWRPCRSPPAATLGCEPPGSKDRELIRRTWRGAYRRPVCSCFRRQQALVGRDLTLAGWSAGFYKGEPHWGCRSRRVVPSPRSLTLGGGGLSAETMCEVAASRQSAREGTRD
jgi:hypothetical protein